MARVRDGDNAAFGELYQRYHDELLFAVRAHLGPRLRSKLESEDILQSVAIEAFRSLPRMDAERTISLRHYLHAMVVNKIRGRADHFDALKRAGDVPLTPSRASNIAQEEEPRYHDGERFERLETAMQALPNDYRRVITLRKVDGLSSKDVAELLGKSDASVRKLYSRALAHLTLLLGDGSEEEEGLGA
jgi:RNA polymerase sigma-70 factor (ECF subfamily)